MSDSDDETIVEGISDKEILKALDALSIQLEKERVQKTRQPTTPLVFERSLWKDNTTEIVATGSSCSSNPAGSSSGQGDCIEGETLESVQAKRRRLREGV